MAGTNDKDRANNASAADNEYREEVVMESEGVVEPDSADYVEADDDPNAIAEGYR